MSRGIFSEDKNRRQEYEKTDFYFIGTVADGAMSSKT
jgi:hypothetical protein